MFVDLLWVLFCLHFSVTLTQHSYITFAMFFDSVLEFCGGELKEISKLELMKRDDLRK